MRALRKERLAAGTARVMHKDTNKEGRIVAGGATGSIKAGNLSYTVQFDDGTQESVFYGKLQDLNRPDKVATQ